MSYKPIYQIMSVDKCMAILENLDNQFTTQDFKRMFYLVYPPDKISLLKKYRMIQIDRWIRRGYMVSMSRKNLFKKVRPLYKKEKEKWTKDLNYCSFVFSMNNMRH